MSTMVYTTEQFKIIDYLKLFSFDIIYTYYLEGKDFLIYFVKYFFKLEFYLNII